MNRAAKGLSGGRKHHFLVVHREEIIAYYEIHGEEATRAQYSIAKDTTWYNFLNGKPPRKRKLAKIDRLEARVGIAEEKARSANARVNELERQYSLFVPSLADQLTKKFFVPLVQGVIELPEELQLKEAEDPLDITDFVESRQKESKLQKGICYVTKNNK